MLLHRLQNPLGIQVVSQTSMLSMLSPSNLARYCILKMLEIVLRNSGMIGLCGTCECLPILELIIMFLTCCFNSLRAK